MGAVGRERPRQQPSFVSSASRAKRLPAWLKILATSRRRQEVLQPVQQAFRSETLSAEDVRNLDDIRSYVEARCSEPALSSVAEDVRNLDDIRSYVEDAAPSQRSRHVLAKGRLRWSEVAALLSGCGRRAVASSCTPFAC